MKKTARTWLANSRVDVRLCKHSYFPLLLAIPLSAFVIVLFYKNNRKKFPYVYIEFYKK
jgi:hypothetical protein